MWGAAQNIVGIAATRERLEQRRVCQAEVARRVVEDNMHQPLCGRTGGAALAIDEGENGAACPSRILIVVGYQSESSLWLPIVRMQRSNSWQAVSV